MGEKVRGLNPELLSWARQRAGLTVAEVAATLGKPAAVVRAWEDGSAAPTYVQLERLAYKVLRRPVALFFFPEPPSEPDPEQSFRTLPDAEVESLSADTRYRIREARAQQLALAELTGGSNPSDRQILRAVEVSSDSRETADRVRRYLGVPMEVQTDTWKTSDEALRAWRAAIEAAGVFVFKHSFKQREVSGFSLFYPEFPLVVINNSTATTRQIFTLFHELAHLLLQVSGVTKADDRYITSLAGEPRRVEVFCNQFAADLLAPVEHVRTAVKRLGTTDESVATVAATYKVSREVILRRLLDLRLITRAHYERKAAEWARQRVARGSGGNYYRTHASYLSERYARLAFSSYYQGSIPVEKLADFLNVSVKSVPGLEQAILQRPTG